MAFKRFIVIAVTLFSFAIMTPVSASLTTSEAGPDLGLEYGASTGLAQGDLRVTVGRIVQWLLGLLAFVLVILIIYAGYLWMTAAGNDEQITKARGIITSAAVGVAIILAAFTITTFILQNIRKATSGG